MKVTAIINVEYDAPDQVLQIREAVLKAGPVDGPPDFHSWAEVNGICSSQLGKAQSELIASAKKLGLKPRGAPDVQFGCRGSWHGPVVLWYQINAE